ncbi:hypothetical protein C8R45DRAFT_1077135 [Mycena sanguinolenta]|nr:hypothetical protein C8R45DRAFT_1077135 [Mycena sanguinolenta]
MVYGDGERAAGSNEVLTNVRDSSESAYEGCVVVANAENVYSVGAGSDPKVAEDNGEDDVQPEFSRPQVGLTTGHSKRPGNAMLGKTVYVDRKAGDTHFLWVHRNLYTLGVGKHALWGAGFDGDLVTIESRLGDDVESAGEVLKNL